MLCGPGAPGGTRERMQQRAGAWIVAAGGGRRCQVQDALAQPAQTAQRCGIVKIRKHRHGARFAQGSTARFARRDGKDAETRAQHRQATLPDVPAADDEYARKPQT
ncbi:hypothetical protein GCM10009079_43150 [Ralstonia mannitolilytica]